MKVLLVPMLVLILSGCASTVNIPDGVDKKSPQNHAYLATDTAFREERDNAKQEIFVLINLDDKYLYRMGKDFEFPEQSYLTSGFHEIKVKYQYADRSAIGCLWVVAETGKRYVVKSELKEYSVLFWIEDEQTGTEVGGVCKAGTNA